MLSGGKMILQIDTTDKTEICLMYKEYLNYGEGIDKYLKQLLSDETMIGFKYIQDCKTIGMLICSKGIHFTILHDELLEQIRNIVKDDIIYTVDMTVTLEGHTNKGIQSRLFDRMNNELKLRNVKWVMIEQWIKKGMPSPEYNLDRHYAESISFGNRSELYKGIEAKKIYCPVCLKNCTCGARVILYYLG